VKNGKKRPRFTPFAAGIKPFYSRFRPYKTPFPTVGIIDLGVQHFIRLKAVVSRHPSGDRIATTYRLVVIKRLPFAEEGKIFIESIEQINIYVQFFVLFRTNEHQSATPLIILLDITIGILFTFKD
jgi:hypothetical protein